MAKSSIEKALEKHQKEVAKNIKKQIEADKKLANRQRRENQTQAKINARRERAASVVSGQPTIGNLKILDPTAEELVSIIINGHKAGTYKISNKDVSIPPYLENDLLFEFEKLKQYGMISSYAYYKYECWELTILPCILTYFERKEIADMEEKQSYNNYFYGDVTGVQIQQGTVDSVQSQTVTQGVDFDAVIEFINNIKKYDAVFDSEFGDKAIELRNRLDGIEELAKNKENPGKIKALLKELKDLALGVTEGLIASGILMQISTL